MMFTSGVLVDELAQPCRVHRGYADLDQTGHKVLVAAVPGKCIRIIAGTFISSAELQVYFSSGVNGTKKSGTFYLVANQGFNLNQDTDGHLQSNKGESLNLYLGSSANIGCVFRYILTNCEDPA